MAYYRGKKVIFSPHIHMTGSTKAHTFDIPTISGTCTYSGAAQSPTITGYYAGFMTLSGDTSKTNAGSYSITVSLSDTLNCQWSDGTTEPITLSWFILKAILPKPTLSTASITLDEDTTTKTFTVNRLENGAITATSSNPSKISASVSGTTVTVTAIDTSEDATSDITITVGESTNYYSYTATDVICSVLLLVDKNKLIITTNAADASFKVCLTVSALGQFSIDWGDGNIDTPSSYTASTYKRVDRTHTYENAGTYIIIFNVPDGVTWSPGGTPNGSQYYNISGGLYSTSQWGTKIDSGITFNGTKGLIELNPDAFGGETKITTFKFANATTTIGNNAITQARNTRTIILGENVTSIGSGFATGGYNCTVNVTCYATTPPVMDAANAFKNESSTSGFVNGTIYVPAESVEAYKAATGWSNKASDIQAIPTT